MSKPPAKREPISQSADLEANGSTEIAAKVERQIGNLISGPQKAKVVAQVIQIVQQEAFSGPIAHPRHLRAYEDILPGTADRIVRMAENNLAHLQDMDRKVQLDETSDMKAGRWFGFIALMVLIVASLLTGLNGETILAALFLGAGVLGVVTSLIKGRGKIV